MADMLKRQGEMLDKRVAEFEAEKAASREDITFWKEELRQAKKDHRQDVASFKQEEADFYNLKSQFLTRREEAVCRIVKEVQWK